MRKNVYLLVVLILIFLLGIFAYFVFAKTPVSNKTLLQAHPTAIVSKVLKTEKVSYAGKTGKDALTLLKEKAAVEQDKSGMVVSINHQKADGKKKEYWAFYVNGKLAEVGAGDYQTKDTDRIEWKIDSF